MAHGYLEALQSEPAARIYSAGVETHGLNPDAVRFMAAGETYAPVTFMSGKDNPEETDFEKALSERERQVLRGLMSAQSNKEIARDLDLQEVTIKLHVKTLCRKLDAKNRTDAAIIARDAGFV